MTAEVEKMFADAIAQRLGLNGADTGSAPTGNALKTMLALSLMQHVQGGRQEPHAAMVRRVAAIVGACPRCLGDDPACEQCGGEGQPGCCVPDRAMLLEWIARPLDRLGLRVSVSRSKKKSDRQPAGHQHLGG